MKVAGQRVMTQFKVEAGQNGLVRHWRVMHLVGEQQKGGGGLKWMKLLGCTG